jgi:hypothetical protein
MRRPCDHGHGHGHGHCDGGGAPSLGEAIARAVRDAAPAGVSPVAWVVGTAGVTRAEAAALLVGTWNPPIEVADAVLRACTGKSLPRVVETWER